MKFVLREISPDCCFGPAPRTPNFNVGTDILFFDLLASAAVHPNIEIWGAGGRALRQRKLQLSFVPSGTIFESLPKRFRSKIKSASPRLFTIWLTMYVYVYTMRALLLGLTAWITESCEH